MRKFIAVSCALLGVASTVTVLSVAATAGTAPVVRSLSTHRGPYWGGAALTVRGANFDNVTKVTFGSSRAWSVTVKSSAELTVTTPWHTYGTVTVRVVTRTGTSAKNAATSYTFARPRLTDKIQGGLTGKQEQRISKRVRAAHRPVPTARRSRAWTAAMGQTAARRATSWLGIPYSWAGGNGRGPTKGVCENNGGDLDCKIIGFDCSGLMLYAWSPYKAMAHYAATQRSQAGKFHPKAGELMAGDLVFFSGYIPNGVGHVAIYVGNGMVVQAEQSGTVVKRSRLDDVIASHGTYRGATRPTSTGRQGAVPSVSGVTASLPTAGGLLTVTGSNLTQTTAVTVSGKRYYSFVSRTANRVVVKVPAHKAGAGSVSVSNAWGTVKRSTTYVAPPTITALSPLQGPAAGGNEVTLTGRGFTGVTAVTVGTTTVPFRRINDTSLVATMPARTVAGVVPLTVTSVYGRSKAIGYTYLAAPSSSSPTTTAPGTPKAPGSAPAGETTRAPVTSTSPSSPSSPTSSPSTPSTSSAPTTTSPAPIGSSATTPAGAGRSAAPSSSGTS